MECRIIIMKQCISFAQLVIKLESCKKCKCLLQLNYWQMFRIYWSTVKKQTDNYDDAKESENFISPFYYSLTIHVIV